MHSLQYGRLRDTDAGGNAIDSREVPSECTALPATVVLSEFGEDRLRHRLKTIASERDAAERQLIWFQERQQFEADIREVMNKQFSAFHRKMSEANLFVISEVKASLSAELRNVSSKSDVGVIRQLDHLKVLLNSFSESVSTVLGAVHDLKAGISFNRPHNWRSAKNTFEETVSAIEDTWRSAEMHPVQKMLQDHQLEVDRNFSHVCNLIRGVSSQEAVVASVDEVIKAVRTLSDSKESMESYAARVKIESDILSRIQTIEASVHSLHEAMRGHTSTLSMDLSKVQDGIKNQKIAAHQVVLEEAIRSLNAQIGQEFTKLQDSMYHEMHIAIKKSGEKVNDEIHDAIQNHNEQFMDRFVWLHETLLEKHSDMSKAVLVHNGQTRQQFDQTHFATIIDAVRKHIEQVLQKLTEISRQKDEARIPEKVQVSPEFAKMYEALERQNERMVDGFARLNEALTKQNHGTSLEIVSPLLSVEDKLQECLHKISGMEQRNQKTPMQVANSNLPAQLDSMNEKLDSLLRELAPKKSILEDIQKTLESVQEGIQDIQERGDSVDLLPDISSSPTNNTQARKSVAFQELKFMQHSQNNDIKNQIEEVKKLFQPEMLRKSIAPVMIDLLGETTRTCHQCYTESRDAKWADGHWYCKQCYDEWMYTNPEGLEDQAGKEENKRRGRAVTFDSEVHSSGSEYEESLVSVERDSKTSVDLIGMQAAEEN